MAGYSSTPLPKKLGISGTTRLLPIQAPDDYTLILGPLPEGTQIVSTLSAETTIVHLFVARRADLEQHLTRLRREIADDTAVWVSWPKKTSKLPTDLTEDTIRDAALPLGFVDIKVCAVTDIWSGLKLVIRKELRGKAPSKPAAPTAPREARPAAKKTATKKTATKKSGATSPPRGNPTAKKPTR